ncbi:hypothetical protein FI667_g718, partial [Globisporangium splendens]
MRIDPLIQRVLVLLVIQNGVPARAWPCDGGMAHVRQGMEVHPDEGGVTKTVGGLAWIILPAGYIGSAVWGMGLVIASADRTASEVAAGVLIFFLLVFIFYAHNNYLRGLNVGFIVLLGGCLALNHYTSADPLQYFTLFVGVMSCLFSIYDIWDDLISRRVNESDASVFAKMTHTSSRCWGVIWGIIAVASLAAAIYFNLLVGEDEGDSLDSFSDASTETKVVLSVAVVIVALSILHTGLTRRCMVRKREGFSGYFSAA